MIRNFKIPLLSLEGKPIERDGKELMLATIIAGVLVKPGRRLAGDQQAAQFELAVRLVATEGPMELTPGDFETIKTEVDKMDFPLAVGQIYRILATDPPAMNSK